MLSDDNIAKESIETFKKKASEAVTLGIERSNLSYRSVAQRTGVSRSLIKRMVEGDNYTIETLITLLDALGYELHIKEKRMDE